MLDVHICVDNVGYDALIDLLVPLFSDKLKESDNVALKAISALPPSVMASTLKALPDSAKEQLLATAVTQSSGRLIESFEKMAADKGITLEITTLTVAAK